MTRSVPFIVLAAAVIVLSGPQLLDGSTAGGILGSDAPVPKCNGANLVILTCPAIGTDFCGKDYKGLNEAQKLKYFEPIQEVCRVYPNCAKGYFRYGNETNNCTAP